MPDLHPGKGYPVGAAIISEGFIYPHLIGADIGCGMALIKTSIKAHKLSMKKLEKYQKNL
jgi:release factor H-coupled RctB family protein